MGSDAEAMLRERMEKQDFDGLEFSEDYKPTGKGVVSEAMIECCGNQVSCPHMDATMSGKNRVKLSLCSRCGVVKYCSRECQRADWDMHKAFCKSTRSTTGK